MKDIKTINIIQSWAIIIYTITYYEQWCSRIIKKKNSMYIQKKDHRWMKTYGRKARDQDWLTKLLTRLQMKSWGDFQHIGNFIRLQKWNWCQFQTISSSSKANEWEMLPEINEMIFLAIMAFRADVENRYIQKKELSRRGRIFGPNVHHGWFAESQVAVVEHVSAPRSAVKINNKRIIQHWLQKETK